MERFSKENRLQQFQLKELQQATKTDSAESDLFEYQQRGDL